MCLICLKAVPYLILKHIETFIGKTELHTNIEAIEADRHIHRGKELHTDICFKYRYAKLKLVN